MKTKAGGLEHLKVEVDGWMNIGKCYYDGDNLIATKIPGRDYYVTFLKECDSPINCLKEIRYISQQPWGRKVIADFLELFFSIIPKPIWNWRDLVLDYLKY